MIGLVQGFPCAHGGDLVLFLELLVPLLQPRAQLQVVAVSGLQVIHHAVLGPKLLPTHLKITGMTCIKITGVKGIKLRYNVYKNHRYHMNQQVVPRRERPYETNYYLEHLTAKKYSNK